MALMRSQVKSGGDWTGIKTGTITAVRDDSSKYSWADVYLAVDFKVEGSDYPRTMKIAGSWEKNPDGTIQDCPLLKKITYFFDAIGEQGGVTQHGEWANFKEEKIDDICGYIMDNYKEMALTIFIYKEQGKDGRAYTRVHNKVLAAGNGSEKELESYVAFLRKKGYLKVAREGDGAANCVTPDTSFNTDELDVANL